MGFMFAGAILMIASQTGLNPLIWIARLISDNGLSDAFMATLDRQLFFLGAAVAGGSVAGWIALRLDVEKAISRIGHGHSRAYALAWSIISGALVWLIQWGLFDNMPHVTDATCHFMQAKIFAGGDLTANAPPCPDAFYQHNMIITRDGLWFSRYPPGTALLITLGIMLRMPWLIFPIVHGVSVLAFHGLANRFMPATSARLSLALYALSPLAMLLGASFMSHTPFMAFAMLGLYFFAAGDAAHQPDTRMKGKLVLSGLLFGATVLFRPQDTFIITLACLICLLWAGKAGFRLILPRVPWALAGATVPVFLFALYNHLIHGSFFSAGYGFDNDRAIHTGITVSMGFSGNFTFAEALRNTMNIAYKFNHALYGWPLSFLFVPFSLLDAGHRRLVRASFSGAACIVLFFFFYSYPAYEYEARFWILVLPFCVALSAVGFRVLWNNGRGKFWALSLLITGFLYAASEYWPHYIIPKYGRNYEEVSRHYTAKANELAREFPEENFLVMIAPQDGNDFNYSSGFIQNEPDLRGQVIFARYRDDLVPCLRDAFPERELYILRPDPDHQNLHLQKFQIDAVATGRLNTTNSD